LPTSDAAVATVVDGTDDEYNDGDDGSKILEMCWDCEVSTIIGVEGSDLQVLLSSKYYNVKNHH